MLVRHWLIISCYTFFWIRGIIQSALWVTLWSSDCHKPGHLPGPVSWLMMSSQGLLTAIVKRSRPDWTHWSEVDWPHNDRHGDQCGERLEWPLGRSVLLPSAPDGMPPDLITKDQTQSTSVEPALIRRCIQQQIHLFLPVYEVLCSLVSEWVSEWILLYVAFCTIMAISRQKGNPKRGLCPTLISNHFKCSL